jgi:hypothetical protein
VSRAQTKHARFCALGKQHGLGTYIKKKQVTGAVEKSFDVNRRTKASKN